MNVDFAIDLMRWFSTSEPTELDYKDPGIHLVLRKDAVHFARIDPVQSQTTLTAPEATGVKAPATGRFVHKHPLDSVPSAVEGRNVESGEIIGYLQIGDVLSAVEAPFAGEISEIGKSDGALIGFGEILMSVVSNGHR